MAKRPPVRVPEPVVAVRRVPGWVPFAALAICVLGLLDAAYLTFEHFTSSSTLACSDNGAINCLKVTTSSYSKVLGIPVALLGLVFFVVMTALCLPPMWRRADERLRWLRLGWAVVGVVSVVYLVWVELFQVDAICLWCTGVHVLTFLLFALVAVEASGALATAD